MGLNLLSLPCCSLLTGLAHTTCSAPGQALSAQGGAQDRTLPSCTEAAGNRPALVRATSRWQWPWLSAKRRSSQAPPPSAQHPSLLPSPLTGAPCTPVPPSNAQVGALGKCSQASKATQSPKSRGSRNSSPRGSGKRGESERAVVWCALLLKSPPSKPSPCPAHHRAAEAHRRVYPPTPIQSSSWFLAPALCQIILFHMLCSQHPDCWGYAHLHPYSAFSTLLHFGGEFPRYTIFKFFLGYVKSTNEPVEAFFISVSVFLISRISFWYYLRVSISLLTIHICSCMLSTFPIKDILLMVRLNSLIIPTSVSYLSMVLMLALTLHTMFISCLLVSFVFVVVVER